MCQLLLPEDISEVLLEQTRLLLPDCFHQVCREQGHLIAGKVLELEQRHGRFLQGCPYFVCDVREPEAAVLRLCRHKSVRAHAFYDMLGAVSRSRLNELAGVVLEHQGYRE